MWETTEPLYCRHSSYYQSLDIGVFTLDMHSVMINLRSCVTLKQNSIDNHEPRDIIEKQLIG